MKLAVTYSYELHEVDQPAYRYYHKLAIDRVGAAKLRDHVRGQLRRVGEKGIAEQVAQGADWLRKESRT